MSAPTNAVVGSIPQELEIIVNIAYRWRDDRLSTFSDIARYPMRTIEDIDAAFDAIRERIVRGLMGLPEWDRIIAAAARPTPTQRGDAGR